MASSCIKRIGERLGLENGTFWRIQQARCKIRVFQFSGTGDEAEALAVVRKADAAFTPASLKADILPDRQGVEELVGDDQKRRVAGQGGNRVVCHCAFVASPVERRLLDLPQPGAGLHQMRAGCDAKLRSQARDAQDVGHQRAATGTQLDQMELLWRARGGMGVDQPCADHFAEELADLGSGDEVAAGAEGFGAHVVAVLRVGQAKRHVVEDGEWPGRLDQRADPCRQRRLVLPALAHGRVSPAFAPASVGGRRRARTIAKRPAAIIGSDRTMPIVSPNWR